VRELFSAYLTSVHSVLGSQPHCIEVNKESIVLELHHGEVVSSLEAALDLVTDRERDAHASLLKQLSHDQVALLFGD
jgi:hypothetical protein